jgi:acetylornithine deacetylase
MDDLETRVLDYLDMDGLVAYLSQLIAVPSHEGNETPAQLHVAAQMARNGLEVEQWELDFDALRRHPAYCEELDRELGLGVVGRMGEGRGRSLILNGHIDVVPPGDLARWSHGPWEGRVAHGRVHGRGALDMKGGLCCALFAVKAIRDAGVELEGEVQIQSVIGEEDGGVGTLSCVMRGHRADAAIIMEPTELMVAPAQAGALNFRITVPGVAAHGAMRLEGVSALEKFIPIYQALVELERERNLNVVDPLFSDYELPYALAVGTVRAGEWASNVPESLTCQGRYGVSGDESVGEAQAAFEQAVAAAAAQDPWLCEHPPVVEWWGGQFHPARIPVDDPIVGTVADAFAEVTGSKATLRGMTYGADMRLLVNEADVPTVLFGPGDIRRAHQPDEFVTIEDLEVTTRTLALAVLRFCGGKSGPE